MKYVLRDIPRLLYLHAHGQPPPPQPVEPGTPGAKYVDPRRADDWMAELVDIRRAWPQVRNTEAGRQLAEVFMNNKPLRRTRDINPALWLQASGETLLYHLNKNRKKCA